MKRSLILLTVLLLLVIPLGACRYNQADLDDARIEGFADGLFEGGRAAYQSMEEEPLYVGSINSDVYHYPWCEWAQKINPENKIWFSSVEGAESKGYRPCKVCKPPPFAEEGSLDIYMELLEGE